MLSDAIDSSDFWRKRIYKAAISGDLHRAVYDIDPDIWTAINDAHRIVLHRHIASGSSVLDAGCGYGILSELLPRGVTYTGIDVSPDLVELGRVKYGVNIGTGDLRATQFPARAFDWAVCRGVEGMVIASQGEAVWRTMEKELLRVADRLLILSYGEPSISRVTDAVRDAKEAMLTRIDVDGGWLDYRIGQDNTAEIYDLLVDETKRRSGLGRRLIERLWGEGYTCLYGFTRKNNTVAQAFYSAVGFTLRDIPGFYRGSQTAVMFSQRRAPLTPGRLT